MKSIILLIAFCIAFFARLYSQSSFTESNSGTSNNLTGGSVKFENEIPCFYVCGLGGVVMKKIGYNGNWVNVRDGLPQTNFHIIFTHSCMEVTLYYTMGGTPYRAYTFDGGTSWTTEPVPDANYISAQETYNLRGPFMNSYEADSIFIYGNPKNGRWSLMITTNNGQTFDTTGLYVPQQGSERGWEYCLDIKLKNVWFGANNPAGLYRSYALRNWQRLPTPGLNAVYCIWFTDTSKGMIGGDNGILYTTNKGDSWTMLGIGGTGGVKGLVCDGGQNWWAARGGSIWFSSNYGANWNMIYTAPSGDYNYIGIDSTRHILIGIRNNGGVTIGISTIGIHPVSNEVPDKYMLEQNYPNPFNPATNVRFRIPKPGFVKITIFDVSGKAVQTLVNEEIKAGTYEVYFDGTGFASGVYYYKLEAGVYSETKKMVLLK
jgi:hypothetical protein